MNTEFALPGDFQSGPGRPVEEINARIDLLSRQVSSLEHSMAGDIRLILSLLQQTLNSSRESSSIEMPGTAGARQSSRAPALVQRSASEPQPPTVPVSNGNGKIQPSTSHGLFRWAAKKEPGISRGWISLLIILVGSRSSRAHVETRRIEDDRARQQRVRILGRGFTICEIRGTVDSYRIRTYKNRKK